MTQDLRIHISADGTATVTSQLDKVNDSIDKVEKKGGFTAFRDGLAMTGLAVNAVTTAFNMASKAVNTFLGPALEQEKVAVGLAASLRNTGIYSDQLTKSLMDNASALQQVSIYGDEAIISGTAFLQNIASLSAEELPKAQKAAIGLASAFRIDLETAFQLIGKAAEGQTGTLSRYGIVLDETLSQEEKFAQVLEIGASKMSLATEEVNTGYGSLAQLKNSWGDLLEVMAGGVIPALTTITKSMKAATDFAQKLDFASLGVSAGFVAMAAAIYKYRVAQIAAFTQTGILTTATFTLSGAIATAQAAVTSFIVALGPVGLAVAGLSVLYAYGSVQTTKYKNNQIDLSASFETVKRRADEATEAIIQNQRAQNINVFDKADKANTGVIDKILGDLDRFRSKGRASNAAKAAADEAISIAEGISKSAESTMISIEGLQSALDSIQYRPIDLPSYDDQVTLYNAGVEETVKANKEAHDLMLQATESYYSATDNLSQRHIDAQLELYRLDIEAKYGNALLTMQIDEMVANKRKELNQMATDAITSKNESALDKLVKDNEVASALMQNSVNTISGEFTRMFQIQTKSSNDAVRVFNSFVNAMIADLSRLIAKQLVSAALTKLIAAGGGSGGGIFSILGSVFGGKSTGGGNGLGNVVGGSQTNNTLAMAVNRLNYNLEGGMTNNVNVYVKPRDIYRASQVGQLQTVAI